MTQVAPTTFSAKSTGDDVAKEFGKSIEGKTVLITGGNTGLGLETARVLAGQGANVIITCRSQEKAEKAISEIKSKIPNASVSGMELELSSLSSVRQFVEKFLKEKNQLHVLILNAGLMACPKAFTTDGFETQFGVCHIAHSLMTELLWPLLKQTGTAECPARIVVLSSIAQYWFGPSKGIIFDDINAQKSYDPWERYGQAKLANLLMAKYYGNLAKTENAHVLATSVHPGHIGDTNLQNSMDTYGKLVFMSYFIRRPIRMMTFMKEPRKKIPQGVATTIFCTLAPPKNIVLGGYYAHCALETKLVLKKYDTMEVAEKLMKVTREMHNSKAK